jgi:hypothetical protein
MTDEEERRSLQRSLSGSRRIISAPTMSITLERFTSPDYQLTGKLTEVPELGGVTDGRLKAKGITSTIQLLGYFLALNRDKAEFIKFLEETGTPASHRKGLANAIAQRVSNCGVKIVVKVPASVDGVAVSSKLDDVKANEIQKRKFNGDIRHDFAGVGFGNATDKQKNGSMQTLERHGITTTDQLFGALLKHCDAVPTTENIVSFWKELKDMGVAGGYKTTIIEAMKLKLDIGIDNCSKPRALGSISERPSPTTETKPRTRELSAGAKLAADAAKRQTEKEREAQQRASEPSSLAKYALPIALLGIGLGYLFLGGSSSAAASLPQPAATEGEWL